MISGGMGEASGVTARGSLSLAGATESPERAAARPVPAAASGSGARAISGAAASGDSAIVSACGAGATAAGVSGAGSGRSVEEGPCAASANGSGAGCDPLSGSGLAALSGATFPTATELGSGAGASADCSLDGTDSARVSDSGIFAARDEAPVAMPCSGSRGGAISGGRAATTASDSVPGSTAISGSGSDGIETKVSIVGSASGAASAGDGSATARLVLSSGFAGAGRISAMAIRGLSRGAGGVRVPLACRGVSICAPWAGAAAAGNG